MLLDNYFIGIVEDNARFFSIPSLIEGIVGCTRYFGYPTGFCQNLITHFQPLSAISSFILAKIVDPVVAYNIIILGTLGLNVFFSFRFFKKLFGRFIAILLSVIFIYSPYVLYQSRSHYELFQFWPVIWYIDTLFFSENNRRAIKLGFLLTLVMGISSYLGYFTLLFSTLYLISKFLFSGSKTIFIERFWKDVFTTLIVFIFSSCLFLAPYIKSNIFVSEIQINESNGYKIADRPWEDFITFSSRPWYYILPSVDNPFFGNFSKNVLNKLSSTDNYLAQNYFKSEHSAAYLGWVNLLLGIFGIIFVLKKESRVGWKINYKVLLIVLGSLIILTMPPSFVFKNITFYTPSLILFKIFSMFMVLSRIGVFILFLTLIFTGFGYLSLIKYLKDKGIGKRLVYILIIPLVVFSISEFFVPLKITHASNPPKVYEYIKNSIQPESPLVVYPYSKTSDAVFWLSEYKQPLINPRSYENASTNFYSEAFTKELNTEVGLDKAAEIGAKYLVYFYENDKGESLNFFDNVSTLKRVETFPENQLNEKDIFNLVKVIEAGSSIDNSAIMYEFK